MSTNPESHRWQIFDAINRERLAQDAKWGEQNHPDVDCTLTDRSGGCTPARMASEYEIPTANRARQNCNTASVRRECTWAHIAIEELAEAVETATEVRQGRAALASTREELVQLAAVIVAWIEAIDRRGTP